MSFSSQELDFLFPLPAKTAFTLPGASAESAETLVRLLKQDFVNFHCVFSEKRFHNHLSHHLCAAYAFGATPRLLQEVYDLHASHQIKAYPSPGSIGIENWKEHLGDLDYYQAYLKFFVTELKYYGTSSTLQRYVFSTEANFGEKNPQMVNRILAGVLHPMIYCGYGIEFGHLGLVAEGLAQAAVELVTTSTLITSDFVDSSRSESSVTPPAQNSNLCSNESVPNVHPLSILGRILKDEKLRPPKRVEVEGGYFDICVDKLGPQIKEYALTWQADTSSPAAVENSVEELVWAVSVVYGIGGFRKGKPFQADFFAAHCVTASLFISPILGLLKQDSKRILLRSYFALLLGVWISQGRTGFDIENFYAATVNLTPPGPTPTPHDETLAKDNLYPNLWYSIAQSVVMHPEEHVLKLARAYAHHAVLYGTSPKGRFKAIELPGSEFIDGSLFIKSSFLSLQRNGWMREGGDKAFWDFQGFFNN